MNFFGCIFDVCLRRVQRLRRHSTAARLRDVEAFGVTCVHSRYVFANEPRTVVINFFDRYLFVRIEIESCIRACTDIDVGSAWPAIQCLESSGRVAFSPRGFGAEHVVQPAKSFTTTLKVISD